MKKSSHSPHLKTACTASNSKVNKQNFEIYKIENNAEWPTHFYKMIELNRKRKKKKKNLGNQATRFTQQSEPRLLHG